MPDIDVLRKKVEQTQAKVDDLREKWAKQQTDALGRQLVEAREKASEARDALYKAVPEEKPPTQRLGL